jgi:hypothetical protein
LGGEELCGCERGREEGEESGEEHCWQHGGGLGLYHARWMSCAMDAVVVIRSTAEMDVIRY